ncbi:hypothetical protein F5B19DRAFT_369373 [Rostrohypoxylon terebratum]|nr:hypothetical protein F5B19DRAFT_369373 [Rostrohypoxylon terebratum]
MAHAWLDSLSEDWVSQPRSDSSQIQLPATPSARPSTSTSTSRKGQHEPLSRIPRYNPGSTPAKPQQPAHSSSASSILNERSTNDINIRGSQRDSSKSSSKSSQEAKNSPRGRRYFSRSVSASTAASVVHNTVQQHKTQSSSPSKRRDSIPEWKKRLVYGQLNYGESKDLFSSAGTGLENIFRPPIAQESTGDETTTNEETHNDMTLPSSPPPYSRSNQQRDEQVEETFEESATDSFVRQTPSPAKKIVFRRTDVDNQDSSRYDHSTLDDSYGGPDEETNEPENRPISPLNPNSGGAFDESRKVSGQSVIRNEDLSPILISFAPAELPVEQLWKRLENLRRNQMILDPEPPSPLDLEMDPAANESQKIDTTDEFVKNGGFLNVQRGGRSGEGSFRRRPLSPPLNLDTSEMLPESSLQASTPKQFPSVRLERVASASWRGESQSPDLPRAPFPSPEKRLELPSGQSGSPLKLFGPYDTFTNQTLLRRISQFEDQLTESPSRSNIDNAAALPTQESPSKSDVNGGFVAGFSPRKGAHAGPSYIDDISTFGAGELDGYEFSEDITQNSMAQSQAMNKENMMPTDHSLPPSQFVKFQLHQDLSSEGPSLLVPRRRHKLQTTAYLLRRSLGFSMTSNGPRPRSPSHPIGLNGGIEATPKRDGSEGKRPRTSPSKDPTPKRRRTLHRSDIAYGLEDQLVTIDSVQSSHRTMQSIIGKKRTVSGESDLQQTASPNILATRQILQPRSPTPGQRSSATQEQQSLTDLSYNLGHQNSTAETSAQDYAVSGSGRASLKTQDYYDVAEEIMTMIRNKARPRNDLSSVEESEFETTEQQQSSIAYGGDECSFQSTREPFSRPPSREGPPIFRVPTYQEDPELADRLKQYEERSDLGEIITNSMHSMGRIRRAINEASSLSESIRQSILTDKASDNLQGNSEVISDLSNVRISRNPDVFGPDEAAAAVEYPTNGSGSSGQSIRTTSSRGSEPKKLIGPHVVESFIGNKVGNMVFDKEKKVWLKIKKPRPSEERNFLPSEDSEDPFASIPDLSVDTAREKQNLGLGAKPDTGPGGQQAQDEAPASPSSGKSSTTAHESISSQNMMGNLKETYAKLETAVEDDKEIEHEISIHEDRMQRSSPSRRRNLTISFSSPIASIIQDVPHHSDAEAEAEAEAVADVEANDESGGQENGTVEHVAPTDSLGRGRASKSPKSIGSSIKNSRSRSRSARNLSVKGQDFIPRPVSRIDEQDEDTEDASGEDATAAEERQLSIRADSSVLYPDNEDKRNTSLSVVVTPAPAKSQPISATPIIGQYVGTLSLSPLSDFTMHQADQSCGLEVSYVVGDHYLVTGDGSKKIMSKAIQNLVEKITEVEPFEPDWESMQELDISDKHLTTLHMLDEFCTSVITLNASNNSIEHLDGVPEAIRNLRITNNHLSELTAWGHLMNLQYVDVSNNQISSLHAFKDLVHLRNLRADNNQITSLDGIKMHDSLQVLRVRGNLIDEVNFDGTKLQRLTELDLENNQITSIQGVEQLTCLAILNLQHNGLSHFSPSAGVSVPNLRYLTLSNNELTTFDVSLFPSLRLLHMDRNLLVNIKGFSRCRRLDSLSLREQRGDEPLDLSFLDVAYEVRKLFLSGNLLGIFNPSVDFLNLQYLELANCGLQDLPPDLGQLMPNLRVLNLNMNAIDDITALRYIPRLKKLLVAGNRLADAGQVADVLAGFPHLQRLDLRDNPATLGFYGPPALLKEAGEQGNGFDLQDADKARDERFSSRSDMGTRMRRRFYELVVLDRCRRLKMLDGLPVDASVKGREGLKRGKVWDKLVESGVVRREEGSEGKDTEKGMDGRVKGRKVLAEVEGDWQ